MNKSEQGFTLIELLVTIAIISILAAIALPSLLNQAAKAKQSEAKLYVSTVNKAQQIYRIEKREFATDVNQLDIGLDVNTQDYRYNLVNSNDQVTSLFNAVPTDPVVLKAYRGAVKVNERGLALSIACQTLTPSNVLPSVDFNGDPLCGDNAEAMR